MRTGHPDPDLRGHRNSAGALQAAPARRRKERCFQGLRGSHPHRGKRAYTADAQEPCQHHGKPREPDRGSLKARPLPHEPLPYAEPPRYFYQSDYRGFIRNYP